MHPFEAFHVLQHHVEVSLVVHFEVIVDAGRNLDVVSKASVRPKKAAYQVSANVGNAGKALSGAV
jgi:hypothetical protein